MPVDEGADCLWLRQKIKMPIARCIQIQKPFRKPSDSNLQEPATTSNNSWTKASLRWRVSIKTGSIGLRRISLPLPKIGIHVQPESQSTLFQNLKLKT